MYKLLFSLVSLFCIAAATAQPHTTKIESQRGESWWGIYVSDSPLQPFAQPFKVTADDRTMSANPLRPILLSSKGRVIHSAQPMTVEFDGKVFTVTSNHEKVAAEKAGKTLRDAYLVCCHKYSPPAERTPDLSFFTVPLYETKIELGHAQGEQEILDYAARILETGFPAGTIIIPDGWRPMSGGFHFNRELYPDPAGMIDKLHAMGFKVMLTVTPFIPAVGKNYVQAYRNGYMLDQSDTVAGEGILAPVEYVDFDGSHLAAVDMGNPEIMSVYVEGLRAMRSELKIDGYRFDCGELAAKLKGMPKEQAFFANWMKLGEGVPMCDYVRAPKKPFAPYVNEIASRAADPADPEGIRRLINNMLSAGLLGFPYFYSSVNLDLGLLWNPYGLKPADGRVSFYDNNPAMAAFFCLQAGLPVVSVDIAPWRITDRKLLEGAKAAMAFRAGLADYMAELVSASARSGEPIVRHMEYQFPNSGFVDCDDQFMLGPHYMFAPPFPGSAKRMVRIPKGTWSDGNGRVFRGPVVTEIDCSDGRATYFQLSLK